MTAHQIREIIIRTLLNYSKDVNRNYVTYHTESDDLGVTIIIEGHPYDIIIQS